MGYILDCPPLPGFQWQNEGSGRDPLLENLRILVGDLFEKNPPTFGRKQMPSFVKLSASGGLP